LNSLQIEASERDGFPVISMLDIIVNSLRLLPEANDSYDVPLYVKKVLLFEDDARYLLDLRYNICAALVLDKLYNVGKMNLWSKLTLLLKQNVTVDFSTLNA